MFILPFSLSFSRKLLASVDSAFLCFSRVDGEGVGTALLFLSSPCDWCVGADMVILGVIHRSQRLQCRSVTISPTMKHLAKFVTEPLSLDYQLNPKSSGSTGRSSFPMPPMQGIYQLMLFPENVHKRRIKYDLRIKTTDPEKLCPEAAGGKVSHSSIFGWIQKHPVR